MSLATCFDPLAFPFQRAQTYVDANPPEVLSEEFYNPVQDALARLFGGIAGYSTSICNDEFVFPQDFGLGADGSGLPPGSPFGTELAVFLNKGGHFNYGSVLVPSAGMFGVYQVRGFVAGDRGAGSGFAVGDSARYLGTNRWLFRARVRINTFATLNLFYTGLGVAGIYPLWVADDSGFWQTSADAGGLATAFPTVDDQWVTLWIGCKDADAVVRFYYQRDGVDAIPVLADTRTLMTASLVSAQRMFRYFVKNTAAGSDYIEIDSIGMICER